MSARPDLILVRTPEDEVGYYRFTESLGIGYVAAVVRDAGFRVEIVDGTLDGLDNNAIVDRVLTDDPATLGFSIVFQGYKDVRAIARELRRRGYRGHITVGQHFATFNAERILEEAAEIDSVVRFEGEETATELVRAVVTDRSIDDIAGLMYRAADGRIVGNPLRPLIADLDVLPFPARDVLARNQASISTYNISGSRGCPWRCKFCTIAGFYREPAGRLWRHRSPARIVDEIEWIVGHFGARPFFFVDDQFLGAARQGRDFARGLATELIERRVEIVFGIETRADTGDRATYELLKRAGLRLVFLGIESGYQPTLDFYRKDITVERNLAAVRLLQDVGLDIQMGFIMFHESTTLAEIRANLDFLEESDAFDLLPFFNELKIQAGSQFMKEMGDDVLTPEYHRSWEISDPRARDYKRELQETLLPLTVPAYALKMEQRFLGSLAAGDTRRFEKRLRQLFMHVARTLVDATERGTRSSRLTEDLRRYCDQQATELQRDIDHRTILRQLRGHDRRSTWMATTVPAEDGNP